MYLHCIDFIKKQKKGNFSEHSPILYDISASSSWKKIAQVNRII